MVNRVILVGNLGVDPEMRQTQSGTAVCNLRIATSRKYKKDDELVEETEWHRVVVWGKAAENCAKYLTKGRQVYVEGRLKTSSYEKDGEKRYSTDVVAEEVKFLGGGKGERSSGGESEAFPEDGGYDIPF